MAFMLPLGVKTAGVLGICNREDIRNSMFLLLDGGSCVHLFTRVLHALQNIFSIPQAEKFHICPAVAA